MYQKIIDRAIQQKKNILVIASPRSGTHPLVNELATLSGGKSLGEICKTGRGNSPWKEFDRLLVNTPKLTVASIVELNAKLILASDVDRIKKHTIIVNIRRLNKIAQFASYTYFILSDPTGRYPWHNHGETDTRIMPGQITASEQDIEQFKLSQITDDFFLPEFKLCYEKLTFSNQKKIKKNSFAFPIWQIFSNLDFVEQNLKDWKYSSEHFENDE
jgi:hypothetical protein